MVLWIATFKYKNIKGYTVLPALNYRVSVLVDPQGRIRIVSNIPYEPWYQRLKDTCLGIALGRLNEFEADRQVEAYAMMYGGLGTFAVIDNKVHVLLLDFINRSSFWFYLKAEDGFGRCGNYDLQDLALMHLALREGLVDLLGEICADPREANGFICKLETSHGVLFVSNKPLRQESNVFRIVPDNAPLRHVVSFVEGGDRELAGAADQV